jgi:hypothetical protein
MWFSFANVMVKGDIFQHRLATHTTRFNAAQMRNSAPGRWPIELTDVRVRNPHDLLNNGLRRKHKIYTTGGDRTLRHSWLAVSSRCAMVMPPTSFMSHSAAAPSPSKPETMTAISLPSQCWVRERRKTVITSGHPLGFEIGLRRNSPLSTCKSRCAGMMNTCLSGCHSRPQHLVECPNRLNRDQHRQVLKRFHSTPMSRTLYQVPVGDNRIGTDEHMVGLEDRSFRD